MGSKSKQCTHSRIFPNDDAVSTVVSFILLFGLILSVIIFVRVQYVPLWTGDVEAEHADDVFVLFSAIPGNIDNRVLANGSVTVSRQRIRLGSGGIPLIAPGTSYGTLGVVPDEGDVTVTADVWAVNISRNVTIGNLTEGRVNITNISSVSSLHIYIEEIEYNTVSPGEVCINITNQENQSGRAEIKTDDTTHLDISIWNSHDDKVIEDMPINDDSSAIINYTINLLSTCYGFDMVMAEAEAEVLTDADTPYYNLTITSSTSLNGSRIRYYIDYNEYNKTMIHYKKTSNGTMMYESRNRHFLNQKFIYQNGAVFLCQQPAATIRRTAPGVLIGDYRNYTRVLIPIISVGTGKHRIPMISGSGVEELQIELKHADYITFSDGNNTESVSIIITPPAGDEEFHENYLQEWADYFNAAVAGTSVGMSSTNATNWDNLTITLSGSIHLEIKDIAVEGRIASISQLE